MRSLIQAGMKLERILNTMAKTFAYIALICIKLIIYFNLKLPSYDILSYNIFIT